MKTIAVIPARGGSKGIPRKNLINVGGKPLLAWSIEAALKSMHIDDVYVSTDDGEISEVSKHWGAKVVVRPDEIADDFASSEDALLHTLGIVGDADELVFLQCTSPLTLTGDIDRAVEHMREKNADSCFTATEFYHFLWKMDEEGRAIGVNHDAAVRLRRQDCEAEFLENGAVYVMNVEGFKKHRHRFFGKTVMSIMPQDRCAEIDVPADIPIIEALLKQREQHEATLFSFVPAAVIFDFDGVFTDNAVILDENGIESVRCDRSDGWGIAQLKKFGMKVAVLSSELNPVVSARCKKLQIECHQGLGEKKSDQLLQWCSEHQLDLSSVIFVGNDVNDYECLRMAGAGVVPADAHVDVLAVADYQLTRNGGCGAVREICDMILRKGKV